MKYKHYNIIFICVLLLSLGCQKESVQMAANSQKTTEDGARNMYELVSETEFKNDFLCSPYEGIGFPKRPPTAAEKRIISIANNRDITFLAEQYPAVKAQMQVWLNTDKQNQSLLIENAALRFLRRLFIDQNGTRAIEETTFLLGVLIELEAVDIDVLADAYKKVDHHLDPSIRSAYFSYMEGLYSRTVAKSKARGIEIRSSYEAAQTDQERAMYELSANKLLQKIKSHTYARDLLGLQYQKEE